MLICAQPGGPGSAGPRYAVEQTTGGATWLMVKPMDTVGVNGSGLGGNEDQRICAGMQINFAAQSMAPRARWRTSLGAAPAGRFTRAMRENVLDAGHMTMPVAVDPVTLTPETDVSNTGWSPSTGYAAKLAASDSDPVSTSTTDAEVRVALG